MTNDLLALPFTIHDKQVGVLDVRELTDEQLQSIHTSAWDEMGRRIQVKIESDQYPKPTKYQTDLFWEKKKVEAIMNYRDAYGFDLRVSKMVLEYYAGK